MKEDEIRNNRLTEIFTDGSPNPPLSCQKNSIHFTKKVGQDKVCMYCGDVSLRFVTITDKKTGMKFTFRPNPLFNE